MPAHSLNENSVDHEETDDEVSLDTHQATTIRRLPDSDVRAIFECLHENKPAPSHLKFAIVPVGANGLKLSPPSYEFADGLYVLLRPHKKRKNQKDPDPSNTIPVAPPHLRHLVIQQEPAETCPWSLSGPQFPPPTAIQQRYCYPKGPEEYSSRKGGALWTMYAKDGKEDLEYRLLHVYFSAKRAYNKGVSITRPEETCMFSLSSSQSFENDKQAKRYERRFKNDINRNPHSSNRVANVSQKVPRLLKDSEIQEGRGRKDSERDYIETSQHGGFGGQATYHQNGSSSNVHRYPTRLNHIPTRSNPVPYQPQNWSLNNQRSRAAPSSSDWVRQPSNKDIYMMRCDLSLNDTLTFSFSDDSDNDDNPMDRMQHEETYRDVFDSTDNSNRDEATCSVAESFAGGLEMLKQRILTEIFNEPETDQPELLSKFIKWGRQLANESTQLETKKQRQQQRSSPATIGDAIQHDNNDRNGRQSPILDDQNNTVTRIESMMESIDEIVVSRSDLDQDGSSEMDLLHFHDDDYSFRGGDNHTLLSRSSSYNDDEFHHAL